MRNFINEALEKIKRERLLEYLGINEGLICTYNLEKVINILRRKYGISNDNLTVEEYNKDGMVGRILTIKVPLNLGANNIGDIKHFLNVCGYSNIDKDNNVANDAYMVLTYEEKFPKEITNKIMHTIGNLYHSTPTINVPKIMKNGIIPKSKNLMFNYPDRVYFFHGAILSDEQKITIANVQLSQFIESHGNVNDFSLLVIYPSKLPDNIKLYTDAVSNGGVFTYDNIPPSAVTSIESCNLYKYLSR